MGRWDLTRSSIRRQRRYLVRQARARNWRAVKNSFNGYLAELTYSTELTQRTCGHGWTKHRAARRLGEYLARDNAGTKR
jgi:hypothetical protein